MKNRKTLLCVSIALAINPVAITFAEQNSSVIEVDENPNHSNNWKSIEIGLTKEEKARPELGINFDHNSPVAKGRNSIAIGTSAEAGGEITDTAGFNTGESIAIGAKAKATKEQAIAIGGDTKATAWGAIVIGGDDLTPLHDTSYGRKKIDGNYVSSEASGTGSIVVGTRSIASGDLSVSLGSISHATGTAANALGATAEANGEEVILLWFLLVSRGMSVNCSQWHRVCCLRTQQMPSMAVSCMQLTVRLPEIHRR
ncbi:hypothetical protein ACIUP7_004930 [Escherichia coli]